MTIRWLMLHKTSYKKDIKKVVEDKENLESEMVDLLLMLADFEEKIKILFSELIRSKDETWLKDKAECEYYMEEISEYFAGNRNLGRQHIDQNYANWFKDIGEKIKNLDYKNSTITGRLIKQIMKALEDIEVYEPVETNVQILHFIRETRKFLQHMVISVNVKKSHEQAITDISDFAYSWKIIGHYLPIMQAKLKEKP